MWRDKLHVKKFKSCMLPIDDGGKRGLFSTRPFPLKTCFSEKRRAIDHTINSANQPLLAPYFQRMCQTLLSHLAINVINCFD